ncbi:MAG: DUF4199 domain-containing protein [Bacteroidota bacterium]|nr:DUF4199 domain-containing protein [uncultured Allomuricauda sp.]
MDENQPKPGKFALRFGLILGAISMVFNIMLMSQGLHYEQTLPIQIIGIVILTTVVIIGIQQFKKANGGFLALGDALKLGTGIAVVAAVIGLLYFFILSNFIEPGFMDKVYEIGKEKALVDNPELTEEQIDQGIAMQKKFAWIAYPVILIIQAVIGLVAGLVGGLIFKKAKPDY